jgi:trans-aconitate methyltransferase
MNRYVTISIASAIVLQSSWDRTALADRRGPTRAPDVIYVPTPEPVVNKMLSMAKVGPDDVVYDLGCGDGRIPIAAVRDFKAKSAVCIEIDPQRIEEARVNVQKAGLQDKVEVRHADMFKVDTSPATVVTLYLLPELNLRLRPKLLKELAAGARIVSQSFDMGDWKPVEHAVVGDKSVFLWNVTKKHQQRYARSKKK